MKPGLKTWAIFEAIRTVLQKNIQIIGSSLPHCEKAQLMMRLVNNIGTKMELASPMISMYLLGNPDHYTSHQFTPFYWMQFIQEVMSTWVPNNNIPSDEQPSRMVIMKKNNWVIGLSPVYDYMFCLTALDDMDLFTWISCCTQIKKKSRSADQKNVADVDNISDLEEENDQIRLDKSKSNMLTFTSKYSLCTSHMTRCIALENAKVPNFLGPGLP